MNDKVDQAVLEETFDKKMINLMIREGVGMEVLSRIQEGMYN